MLSQRAISGGNALLDSPNVRGRMIFSLSLFQSFIPTLGGEGESSKSLSCAGTDRAERAPYPRNLGQSHGWAKRADQRCGGALISSPAAQRRASRVAMRSSLGRGVTALGRQEGLRFFFSYA